MDTGFRGRGAGKGRHTTIQGALYGRLMAGNSNYFPYTYSNYVNDKHICQGLLLKAVWNLKKKMWFGSFQRFSKKMCTVS